MNPKLQKYTAERERNIRRIAALQERNGKLDKMIAVQENLELHALLRGANMSYAALTEYVRAQSGQYPESEAAAEDTPEMSAAALAPAVGDQAGANPYDEPDGAREDAGGDGA